MCGLFGIVLTRPLRDSGELDRMIRLFNALAICSVHRGSDATGVAIVEPEGISYAYKDTVPASTIIDTNVWRTFMRTFSNLKTAALIGHTRFGTHGENVPGNAHPFRFNNERYGVLTGTHNGVIYNHRALSEEVDGGYANDSANLFKVLSTVPEQRFGEVLEAAYGSFALVFTRRNTIYMTRNEYSPLYLSKLHDYPFLVYASEAKTIRTAIAVHGLRGSRPRSMEPFKLYAIGLRSFRERVMEYEANNTDELLCELEDEGKEPPAWFVEAMSQ